MAALPPLRLLGGLNSTPMDAGPNDCAESINVHGQHGRLVKRLGAVPLLKDLLFYDSLPGGNTDYRGWGTDSVEPATVSNAGAALAPPSTAETTIYLAYPSAAAPPILVRGNGSTKYTTDAQYKAYLGVPFVQYWNGSAWTTINHRLMNVPGYSISAGAYTGRPFMPVPTGGIGPVVSGVRTSFLVEIERAPSDWALKTIGGQSKYWIRIRNLYNGQPGSTSDNLLQTSFDLSEAIGPLAEVKLISILPYTSRNGGNHIFKASVWINSAGGNSQVLFSIDGVLMVQSDNLQPVTTKPVFNKDTEVVCYYHAATDRCIGWVEPVGWFFFNNAKSIFGILGNIFHLAADPIGTSTPYENIPGGLRSAIPEGRISTMYDGRFFCCVGQQVIWSSPDVYADIWPNSNEITIQDDAGRIVGIAAVGGVLAVFKRNKIWVMQSDGSADGYTAYPIPGNVGCVSHKSIVVIGNQCIFLAEDGIYSFDGQGVRKLSEKIQDFISSPEFSAGAESAWAVYYSQLNQYRLFYRSSRDAEFYESAIYMDMHGVDVPVAKGNSAIAFWLQGAKAGDVSGFRYTCFAQDNTTPVNRVLAGDNHAFIWELDNGNYDRVDPVKSSITSHRIGLGSSQKNLLRWITPAQPVDADHPWSLSSWVDGRQNNKQTATMNAKGANTSSVFVHTGDVVVTGQTAVEPFNEQTEDSASFVQVGRFMQMRMEDDTAGPWRLDSAELEVTRWGRRG